MAIGIVIIGIFEYRSPGEILNNYTIGTEIDVNP